MKKFLAIAAVALVVVVVLALLLPFIIDLNRYKEPIISAAEDALGRKVDFEELELSLLGGLGVTLQNLEIASREGFSAGPLLKLDALDVNVKLLPLIRKEIAVKRVVLDRPAIIIERNQSGALSIDDLIAPDPEPGGDKGEKEAEAGGPSILAGLLVSSVTIHDGVFRFIDHAAEGETPVVLGLEEIDLKVTDVAFDVPVRMALRAALTGTGGTIGLEGTFGPVPESFSLEMAKIDLDLSLDAIGAAALSPLLGSEDGLKIVQGTAGLDLKMRGGLTGTILTEGAFRLSDLWIASGENKDDPIELDGKATMTLRGGSGERETLSGEIDMTGMSFAVPEVFVKNTGTSMRLDLDLERAGDTFTVKTLDLSLAGSKASLAGSIRGAENPELDLDVTWASGDLAGLKALLPALADLGLGGKLNGTASITGRTDDVRAAYKIASPMITMTKEADGGADVTDTLEDLEVSGTSRISDKNVVSGRARIAKGKVSEIPFEKMAAGFELRDDRVRLRDLKLDLFGGSVEGIGAVDLPEGKEPSWSFVLDTRDLDVARAAAATTSMGETIKGRFTGRLSLSGNGTEVEAITRSVSGDGHASITDGIVENFNLIEESVSGLGGVAGATKLLAAGGEKTEAHRRTRFEKLTADFNIGDGAINLKEFKLFNIYTDKVTQAEAVLTGRIGLDQTLDLKGRISLSPEHSAELVAKVKELDALVDGSGRMVFPLMITGKADSPKVRLDNQAILKSFVKNKAGQEIEKGIGNLLDQFKKRR